MLFSKNYSIKLSKEAGMLFFAKNIILPNVVVIAVI